MWGFTFVRVRVNDLVTGGRVNLFFGEDGTWDEGYCTPTGPGCFFEFSNLSNSLSSRIFRIVLLALSGRSK